MAKIDVDGDGIGEYGTLAEMTGTEGVRMDATGSKRGPVIYPPVLSPALANVDSVGVVTKSGYAFRITLPGENGAAVREGKPGYTTGGSCAWHPCPGRNPKPCERCANPPPLVHYPGAPCSGPVDPDAAEVRWCAYAWPVAAGNSGTRAFYVDQDGEVWQTANALLSLSGVNGGPAWDAALPQGTGNGWVALPKGASHTGRDGNVWIRTN